MRRAGLTPLTLALALIGPCPSLAQLAPDRAPVPVARPVFEETDAANDEAQANAVAEAEPSPTESEAGEPTAGAEEGEPPEDGADEADAHEDTAPAEPADASPDEPPMPRQLAESDLELGICLGRLATFGTVYERAPAVADEAGACGIAHPVRIIEIVPGVALAPPDIMRCEAAAALAEWVARFALPASTLLPERGPLVEVAQGSTYVCRNIGTAPGGDLSEHAFGNAIDVMGFGFARGAPIPIEPREREGTAAAAFQHAVRAAACLSFATVLGPGVEAHEDHLHLDVKARESGYRYCR
jgi:hypothetical protein